jgi:hypothetical protein
VILRVELVLGVLGFAVGASAQDTENVAIHGFGGWAIGDTSNDNRFGAIASSDRELENHYFALNVAATPSEDVAIHTQANFSNSLRGQRVEMDYLFAQWSPTPSIGVRAGKVKNPMGLSARSATWARCGRSTSCPLGATRERREPIWDSV